MSPRKPEKPPRHRLTRQIEFEEQSPLLRSFRPLLRDDVTIIPQTFRGKTFHVLQDPVSLQYFRVGERERAIIDMFDGRRTLADIHTRLREDLADAAPGFDDLAHFVFSLRGSNLLVADVTDKFFVDRAREKRKKQILSTATNFLFVRIPLIDPERFLNRTVRYVRWIFTLPFFLVWIAVVAYAVVLFVLNADKLWQPVNSVLAPANLPLLWIAFVFIKFFHEFGHAYAAKAFGSEVHRMGVLFLVFMPCLYVDVTPVWSFPKKWTKVLVGTAGMLTELFVASLALFLWLNLDEGHALRAVMFNVIFIASVSTILFNANPLLRYDGYYILADMIEIPNLRTRSGQYLLYLIQRYIFGIQKDPPPHEPSERSWLINYGILATVYRVFIVTGIILFIAGQLFIIGALLAAVTVVVWLLVPLGKGIRFLFFSPHTYASRPRAALTVLLVVAALVGFFGFLPFPRRVSAPCVLQPAEEVVVYPRWPGFLSQISASDGHNVRQGDLLAVLRNDDLRFELDRVNSDIRASRARLGDLQTRAVAASQAEASLLATLQKKRAVLEERNAALTITAPIDGRIVAPDIEKLHASYLKSGSPLLRVASFDQLELHVALDENTINEILRLAAGAHVRLRMRSHPDQPLDGTITKIASTATDDPPAPPLTDAAGGPIVLNPSSGERRRTLLPWFKVTIDLQNPPHNLMLGTTGIVKFEVPPMPLAERFYWAARRLFQKRFLW